MTQSTHWTRTHSWTLLLLVVGVLLVGLLLARVALAWAWVINLVLFLSFTSVAGHGITGLWRGLFIDERNKISLSRFQMVMWTVVVLSAYLTAALYNIRWNPTGEPLGIAIPYQLWILMGISTTSLVGSPLIKTTKKQRTAADEERQKTLSLLEKEGVPEQQVRTSGQLVMNAELQFARWSDMFKGEETGTAAHLDLSKIQMFYFTIVLVIAYAVLLGAGFAATTGQVSALPSLDSSILALLGISHAGYLTHKAMPLSGSDTHTP